MPKLKIVGCDATDSGIMQEHAIPEYDRPTELALEHMKLKFELKKSCHNSSLPNVRFLRIYDLDDTDQAVQDILNLGLGKLESLYLDDCASRQVNALVSAFSQNLTVLEISCSVGAIDFLEIIDLCPNLKELDVGDSNSSEGVYQFGSSNYIQRTPQHLERLSLSLKNELGVQLPPGAMFRY